jgi:hypothetical protein
MYKSDTAIGKGVETGDRGVPVLVNNAGTYSTLNSDSSGNMQVKLVDTTGVARGILFEDGCPTTRDYEIAIAENEISSHVRWSKIGFTPNMTTTDNDIWSYGTTQPVYVFPTSAAGMEVVSSDNTQDIGTILFNATCDVGGSTTTLIDVGVDFTATVVAGDILIIDKSSTTPEWGYITSVANGSLTFSGGLSSGGSCVTARTYQVLDYSAKSGAFAVKVEYLDGSYAEKLEIIILNGTTVVPTINLDLFRINSFRIIAAGSGAKPVGNLFIRNLADTPVYSYITAGYTRARNIIYTVPYNKNLWVNQISCGFSLMAGTKWEFARIWTRANREPSTGFLTNNIFYSYTEIISNNQSIVMHLPIPTKLLSKTDIKMSGIASSTGVAVCSLRGWTETV